MQKKRKGWLLFPTGDVPVEYTFQDGTNRSGYLTLSEDHEVAFLAGILARTSGFVLRTEGESMPVSIRISPLSDEYAWTVVDP